MRIDAAVADRQAVLVAEDDVITLAMARAHERCRRDTDAHAADAGEIAVPRLRKLEPAGQGNLQLVQLRQA